jgi:hypothetical protein
MAPRVQKHAYILPSGRVTGRFTYSVSGLQDIRQAHRRMLEADIDRVDRNAALMQLKKGLLPGPPCVGPVVQSDGVPELSPDCRPGVNDSFATLHDEQNVNLYQLEATQQQLRRRREERSKLFVAELRKKRLSAITGMSKLD